MALPAEPAAAAPQADATAAAALVFQQVSGGRGHTCGLASDGTAWGWGDNDAGALGTGNAYTWVALLRTRHR